MVLSNGPKMILMDFNPKNLTHIKSFMKMTF